MNQTDINILKEALENGDVHFKIDSTFLEAWKIGIHHEEETDCIFFHNGKYAILENTELEEFFYVTPITRGKLTLRNPGNPTCVVLSGMGVSTPSHRILIEELLREGVGGVLVLDSMAQIETPDLARFDLNSLVEKLPKMQEEPTPNKRYEKFIREHWRRRKKGK